MALKGHNRQGYCIITETEGVDGAISETLGTGVITSHVVSFKGSTKKDSTELYAGDQLEETEDGAVSADVSIDISQLSLKDEAALCGHTYVEATGMDVEQDDSAPYVRYAAIGVGKKNGEDFFRLVCYYRVRFGSPDDDYETKKSGATFKTHALTGKSTPNCDGKVIFKNDFDTFVAALTKMKTLLNVT